ncbi:MAG: XdhC family protein [Thermoanaerobacteraceae bacterium]|nr:XdhC family protein [Thermoanaerobacteraceae bacterium]
MLSFFRELKEALDHNRPAVAAAIVRVSPGGYPAVKPGGRSLYYTNGEGCGSLGDPRLDALVAARVPEVFARRRPQLVSLTLEDNEVEVFLEPVLPEPKILILGGGHVGQKVAALAKEVGYRVTVVDDRPAFANPQLFPHADEIICRDFADALQNIQIDPATYVVIVTRGHRHDYECLRQVIGSPAAYIGMIGSRRKVQGVRARLLADGIPQEALDRVHAPIGVDIGAETPGEIGVSILAEIIRVYREGR